MRLLDLLDCQSQRQADRRATSATYTTYTATEAASDVTTAITIDHGSWDVTVTITVTIEPAQEQDEPNAERDASVTWERPNRRPATVNRAGRVTKPRKAASTWG